MKVVISIREIYHKSAKVEIDVPDDWKTRNGEKDYYTYINDYLHDYEELYIDKIDEAIDQAEYKYGFGLGDGMDEKGSESEWRYDYIEEKTGGHL